MFRNSTNVHRLLKPYPHSRYAAGPVPAVFAHPATGQRNRRAPAARMARGAWAGALVVAHLLGSHAPAADRQTWMADNGNGTYTNPLFFDEFSDPDLIRVGEDFYLTGTTMHTMPGLPILHSRDLVNWELLGYALDRLDLGPAFRLENGQEIYGQGIWAPSFRYRPQDRTFHIFANVNKFTTQHFMAGNPAGPWTRTAMKCSLHDLSVLFDDDGHAYVVWGYRNLQFAQLNDDLTDIVPGTQRTLIEESAGMGEGSHFYKFNGEYLHHQCVVRRPHAHGVRAVATTRGSLRGESRDRQR